MLPCNSKQPTDDDLVSRVNLFAYALDLLSPFTKDFYITSSTSTIDLVLFRFLVIKSDNSVSIVISTAFQV